MAPHPFGPSGRFVWLAVAAVGAGLALSGCERTAPSPAAGAASAASAVAAAAPAAPSAPRASVFKPFEFEIVGAMKGMKDGTELFVVPVSGQSADDSGSRAGDGPRAKGTPIATGTVQGGQISIKGTSPLPQWVYLYRQGGEYAIATLLLQEGRMELTGGQDTWRIANARYGTEMAKRFSPKLQTMKAESKKLEADLAAGTFKGKARAAAQERLDALSAEVYNLAIKEEVPFILDTKADPFERLLTLETNVDDETLTPAKRLALLDELEQQLGPHPAIDGHRRMNKQVIAKGETVKTLASGARFKEVIGNDLSGKEVRLSDMVKANKVVLLDIWASWCESCRAEFLQLKKVYAKHHAKGFEVFSISIDEQHKEWVKAMAQDKTTTSWPQMLEVSEDSSARVEATYGVVAVPSMFLIATDGTIVANNHEGKLDLDERLTKLLQ